MLGVLVFESKPYLREAAGLLLQDLYLNRWPLFMVSRWPEIELRRTAGCAVEYRLVLTEAAEAKYGSSSWDRAFKERRRGKRGIWEARFLRSCSRFHSLVKSGGCSFHLYVLTSITRNRLRHFL